jgi:hypothetical protein
MSYEFHTEEYKGCTIRIEQDEHREDPRTDYDHLSTMIPWDNEHPHRGLTDYDRESLICGLARNQLAVREKLIDKMFIDLDDHEGLADDPRYMDLPDADELIELACADNVILPYNYYDGSQSSVSETSDWERCTGYIYIPMNVARDNWSGTDEEIRAAAEACLRAELKELDQWINGNVAGWIAEDPDGKHIDSCWGYYPDEYPKEWDYPISEARSAIDHWAKEQHELAIQQCTNI